jgi:hypothetical protein
MGNFCRKEAERADRCAGKWNGSCGGGICQSQCWVLKRTILTHESWFLMVKLQPTITSGYNFTRPGYHFCANFEVLMNEYFGFWP